MPYRRQPLVNNEIYHIVQRRIGDELMFKDINDYYRGIFSIYEFNTSRLIKIRERRKARARIKKENTDPTCAPDARDHLVELLAFCFMPNHIHLLVRQLKDNGISTYMKKMGGGYAGYFKERYDEKGKGYFFQDRFTSVHIKDDNQLRVVFVYIHANPISLVEPRWKEKGIKNPNKVIKFLESYKWSSYQDYIGKPNFTSVTEREFILELMGGEQGCRDAVEDWAKHKGKTKEFSEIALE